MDSLFFKCSCCEENIRMKKEIKEHFTDWAYYYGVEWSDFDENIPVNLDEDWNRSETTPVVDENRTLYVCKPFDESLGSEFKILYEPALCHFNGWDSIYENEIEKCAIIRCKLTKIIKRNEYEAWVVVKVQEVVPLNNLIHYYNAHITDEDITMFDGIPERMYKTCYKNNNWIVTSWDAQGDCGEDKWIYIDEKGKRHLVMQSWFDFDISVVYIGNIIQKKIN